MFGASRPPEAAVELPAALAGFFANAGISASTRSLAQAFPTHVRATGTGFAIGIGRRGSIIAPIIAGYLMQSGIDAGTPSASYLASTALVMGMGSLIGAIVLVFLKFGNDKHSEAPVTDAKGMKSSMA